MKAMALAVFWLATAGVAAAAGAASERLLVTPFSFSDSSGEPQDQRADHERRLRAMSSDLKAELQKEGRYQIVEPPADSAPCPEGESPESGTACILQRAQDARADLVLTGAVHKVSTMASLVWVGLFDARDGKQLLFRQLTFRGDTDDAWSHATSFLGREIGEVRLEPR